MSLRSAAAHRNLLYLLSLKELRTRYKKSVLGWAWSLLNPITQTLIFSVIFLYVFVASPPTGDPSGIRNFPAYFLCGLLPFNFFSISVGVSIASVQGGSGLIKKVQFPHEHLVFSVIVAQFVTLLIELVVLVTVLMLLGNMVLPWLPMLMFVLVLWAMFTSGVALFLSAANVFYHDVNYLWTILSQVLFYMTPVIYAPQNVGSSIVRAIANYGPTGSYIVAIHEIMYDLRLPSVGRMAYLVVLAFGVFFAGAWVFNRLSPKFAEEM
jgi:ABC-type polysaccharide/polyol phosphate export permease